MDKADLSKILKKISNVYSYWDKKNEDEKKKVINAYWEELSQYSCQEILDAIDILSSQSHFIPSVAEIKVEINNKKTEESVSNINWNSSYWIENDREMCEKFNIPYFDETKGIDVPLAPYKS